MITTAILVFDHIPELLSMRASTRFPARADASKETRAIVYLPHPASFLFFFFRNVATEIAVALF